MKITNRFNLPQPFVDAVSFDDYAAGEKVAYSTTGLLKPPRIAVLSARHWNELTEDAADRVWRMSGQTKHVVLERIAKMNPDRYMAEHRFFMEVSGLKISGQIDLYDRETKTLYDWKETSIWKVVVGSNADWEAQANINAMLARQNEIEIKRLVNIAFLKDWKRREADTKADYPQAAIQSCPLDLWPLEKTMEFIQIRIALHESAKTELPLCSDEERWAKPERWALMKKGAKRAIKLYETEEQANAAWANAEPIAEVKPRHFVEHRAGENTRCLFYCPVSAFCQQFRDLMQNQ